MYYSVFYSNKKLLNIYNKRIPKLWDELIETSKYILRKEKEKGSNIIGYNGLFTGILLYQIKFIIYNYKFFQNKKKKKKLYL